MGIQRFRYIGLATGLLLVVACGGGPGAPRFLGWTKMCGEPGLSAARAIGSSFAFRPAAPALVFIRR